MLLKAMQNGSVLLQKVKSSHSDRSAADSKQSPTLSSSHTHATKKYHAAILLLGIHPRPLKHYVHTLSSTGICKAALFIKAKEKRTIHISVRMNN